MRTGAKIALGVGAGLLALTLLPQKAGGSGFIIGGKFAPSVARVQTWEETGMFFPGLKDRKTTRGVVLHFSGSAAATPKSVYNTLVSRNLNVQLSLGRDGVFSQFCDLNKRCVHANEANDSYLGIEICSDGKSYTREQVTSLLAGLRTILGAYGLPWQVPTRNGQLVTGVLTGAEFNAFRGILGHYMVSNEKTDPGVPLMRAVAAQSASLVA